MEQLPTKQRQLVSHLSDSANDVEKIALSRWASGLLEIRQQPVSSFAKAQRAIALTRESKVVWPVLRLLATEIKRFGWDERSLKGRMGIGGAAIGLAVFGGQGAGIAALGTAIGVPLWVVLGSGAMFAGALLEELGREKQPKSGASYRVIDAEKER